MRDAETVGKNVRIHRELAVLSIRELAAQAGIAQATLWSIEAGRQAPQPRTLRKIAVGLDIEPRELLTAVLFNMGSVGDAPSGGPPPAGGLRRANCSANCSKNGRQ